MMFAAIWKQLKSPELSPSTITWHSWDGHSSKPLGMYCNFPVTLARNTIHLDIEVIDAPLDQNILLGHSYTYAMSIITSMVFRNMCFPHEGNIITID